MTANSADRMPDRWLTSQQAAQRLDVKSATVYAYASRGLLRRYHTSDGSSRFSPADIERLVARGRHGQGIAAWLIESSITSLQGGVPCYRGYPIAELATSRSFEEVATLLWRDEFHPVGTWTSDPTSVAVAHQIQAALPSEMTDRNRLRVVVATMAGLRHSAISHDVDSVAAAGRNLVATMVDSLPIGAEAMMPSRCLTSSTEVPIATRLWRVLAGREPAAQDIRLLDAALVYRADHELAATTLAARVAAASGADPYAVVLSGLGVEPHALGAPSTELEHLLRSITSPTDATRAVSSQKDQGLTVPGFGHPVYPAGDPRGPAMLDLLLRSNPPADRMSRVTWLLEAAGEAGLPPLNAQFPLSALSYCYGLRPGASQIIAAVARTAGWLAHALEEYSQRSLGRLRAVYVGTPPPSSDDEPGRLVLDEPRDATSSPAKSVRQ